MRRCDTCRSRDRDADAMFLAVSDKSINQIRLPTSSRSGEEYILPHSEYVERLILIHVDECMKKEDEDKKKSLEEGIFISGFISLTFHQ
jgi:hypothetical protein